MLRVLTFAVLLIVTALPVSAGFKEGVADYKRGDYRTAFREMKTLAEQGNAGAQIGLGLMHNKGSDVPKNYALAVEWYRKAALQGNANAQLNFGIMNATGQGVPKIYTNAYMWRSLSAARGNKTAAKNLEIVEKRMTYAQVAQAMAAKWKPKKAKQMK